MMVIDNSPVTTIYTLSLSLTVFWLVVCLKS